MSDQQTDPLIGTALGDFTIVRIVGAGSSGSVYEAEDILLHRKVAIKIFPFQCVLGDERIESIRREAELAAKLNHPNIVKIYGFYEQPAFCYCAMEYLEGVSLDRIIARLRGAPAEDEGEISEEHKKILTEIQSLYQQSRKDYFRRAADWAGQAADASGSAARSGVAAASGRRPPAACLRSAPRGEAPARAA